MSQRYTRSCAKGVRGIHIIRICMRSHLQRLDIRHLISPLFLHQLRWAHEWRRKHVRTVVAAVVGYMRANPFPRRTPGFFPSPMMKQSLKGWLVQQVHFPSFFFFLFLWASFQCAVACVPKSNPTSSPPFLFVSLHGLRSYNREGGRRTSIPALYFGEVSVGGISSSSAWMVSCFSLPFFLLYLPQTSLSEFPWNKFESHYKKLTFLICFFPGAKSATEQS